MSRNRKVHYSWTQSAFLRLTQDTSIKYKIQFIPNIFEFLQSILDHNTERLVSSRIENETKISSFKWAWMLAAMDSCLSF